MLSMTGSSSRGAAAAGAPAAGSCGFPAFIRISEPRNLLHTREASHPPQSWDSKLLKFCIFAELGRWQFRQALLLPALPPCATRANRRRYVNGLSANSCAS